MTDRILVIRGGALGDFILGLPALQTLREAFPESTLELVAPTAVLPLASALVDVATPLERAEMATLFSDSEHLPGEIVARYGELDLAVLWLADADESVRRNFERLGARRILSAPALPSGSRRHAAEYLLDTLEPLEIDAARPGRAVPSVRPETSAREKAVETLRKLGLDPDRPVVAIHPGSGGKWKIWALDRFARVVDHLIASDLQVVLIQGPADEESVREVLAASRLGPPPVIAGLDVVELAAFLSICSCYLGNDSGVAHLSAAVGTPTIAIFGSTNQMVWGTRGRQAVVLHSEKECFGCMRDTNLGCKDRTCLDALRVDRVLEVLSPIVGCPPLERSVYPPSL